MRDLKDVRTDINETDKEIIKLFERRMDLSKEVALYKAKNSLPVFDSKREAEKLAGVKLLVKNQLYADWAVKLMNDMMLYSKEYQKALTDIEISSSPKNVSETIAFQGVRGAYGEEAAISYFGQSSSFRSFNTFEDVFASVLGGECGFGVLPFENSQTGTIADVFNLLLKYDLYIVGEYKLKINHLLLGTKDAQLSDIKKVVSHSQALFQCGNFLNTLPGITKELQLNTALSAKMVAQLNDKTIAAIASPRAKDAYNLKVLAENIADSTTNTTRFIVISKNKAPLEKPNKVSAIFGLSHTKGSLSQYLSNFAKYETNLLKLESRPISDNISKFNFFVDFEADLDTENSVCLLKALKSQAGYFKLLGNYKAHDQKETHL